MLSSKLKWIWVILKKNDFEKIGISLVCLIWLTMNLRLKFCDLWAKYYFFILSRLMNITGYSNYSLATVDLFDP